MVSMQSLPSCLSCIFVFHHRKARTSLNKATLPAARVLYDSGCPFSERQGRAESFLILLCKQKCKVHYIAIEITT